MIRARRFVDGRTATAYHEAGHVVVARTLGCQAQAVVGIEGGRSGHATYETPPDLDLPTLHEIGALRSLAGPIAEQLVREPDADAGLLGTKFRGVVVAPLKTDELREMLRFLRAMDESGLSDDYRKASMCAYWLRKRPRWLLTVARKAQRILLANWPAVEAERRLLMRKPAENAHSSRTVSR